MMFLVYCIDSKDAYEGTPFLKRLWQTRVVLTRTIAAVAVGFRDFSIIIHPSQCPGHPRFSILELQRLSVRATHIPGFDNMSLVETEVSCLGMNCSVVQRVGYGDRNLTGKAVYRGAW